MMLPWWSKYVGYFLILSLACTYTGFKVAGHYEARIASMIEVGKLQERRTKQIETKQREVVKNVNQQVKRDIALSDDFYLRLRDPHPGQVPYLTGTPGTVNETPETVTPDPSCDPKDGSADAITILGWQRFYSELREAQNSTPTLRY